VVIASLSLAGGLVGGLCAATTVAVIALAEGGAHTASLAPIAGISAMSAAAGAFVGVIAAPLIGFGLLRYVPIGRSILVTALATIVGGLAGEALRPFNPYTRVLPGVIVGALGGFVLSAIALRLLSRRSRAASGADAV
jgi:hypothetical protein